MEGGGDCCSWFSCAGCTSQPAARGGKGHLQATVTRLEPSVLLGAGWGHGDQDPGLRAGWGRPHLDPGDFARRKHSEGGGTKDSC